MNRRPTRAERHAAAVAFLEAFANLERDREALNKLRDYANLQLEIEADLRTRLGAVQEEIAAMEAALELDTQIDRGSNPDS